MQVLIGLILGVAIGSTILLLVGTLFYIDKIMTERYY